MQLRTNLKRASFGVACSEQVHCVNILTATKVATCQLPILHMSIYHMSSSGRLLLDGLYCWPHTPRSGQPAHLPLRQCPTLSRHLIGSVDVTKELNIVKEIFYVPKYFRRHVRASILALLLQSRLSQSGFCKHRQGLREK